MMPLILDNTLPLTDLMNDSGKVISYGDPIQCVSATVHEERNGAYYADLIVPINSRYFSKIELNGLVTILTPNLERNAVTNYYVYPIQCFRIVKISKPINGLVSIHCNHISYDLNYLPGPVGQYSMYDSEAALLGVVRHQETGVTNVFDAISNFNIVRDYSTEYMEPGTIRSYIGGQEGSLMDVYHAPNLGEFEWSNLLVMWWNQRGEDRGSQIVYGEDLIDFNLDEELTFIPNAVVGCATYDDGTGDFGEHIYYNEASDVKKKSGVASDNVRVMYVDFSDQFTKSDYPRYDPDAGNRRKTKLNTLAQNYVNTKMASGSEIDFNLKINFADLKTTTLDNNIHLCDTIRIIHPKYNFDAKAKVIAYDYDALNEKYISIEVGQPKLLFENVLTNKYVDASVRKIQNIYK